MDVQVSQVKSRGNKKYLLTGLVCLFIGLFIWLYSQPSASSKVDASSLRVGEIKKGTLTLEVTGFGVLESKEQRFLTAFSDAVVEEILLKPGAAVTPQSIILKMSNPSIEQAVVQAKIALNAQKGKLRQLLLNQEREMLEALNQQSELQLDLKVIEAKLAAEEKLAKTGIVTQLTLLETHASVNKLSGRLENNQKRLEQLGRLHQQSQQLVQEEINEKQSLFELAQDRMSRMHVKAGIHGILQALPIELGQSVSVGSQLALVGGTDKLIAVIQVPQRDVQGMTPGKQASIDTRGGTAKGVVKRIDPVVVEGNIEVEIELLGNLPNNARPALNVEAKIQIEELKDTLYIKAPVNGSQYSRHPVFKIDEARKTAQMTWLQFGAKTGQYIEVRSGGLPSERFILNDMQKYKELSEIALINL